MQKVINTIALISGLVPLSVVVAGAYLYMNKDAMIEDIRKQATEQVTKAMTEALPGIIDAALPELPEMPTKDLLFGSSCVSLPEKEPLPVDPSTSTAVLSRRKILLVL